MKINFRISNIIFLALIFLLSIPLFLSCSSNQKDSRSHYFLKGYDHLEFRNQSGIVVPISQFITSGRMNGARMYMVRDTSLNLVHKRTGKPYSGYIRTFQNYRYNLQGEFKDGKIFRLRFWHPNRKLGMDANYMENTGTVWNQYGMITASWNEDEIYYLYPGTQTIRQIISDSLTSYFNPDGELSRYTTRNDTAIIQYFADGTPRYQFPRDKDGLRNGVVKRWYTNGQLRVRGQYQKGRQAGTWIEYDSLGNVINKESWD